MGILTSKVYILIVCELFLRLLSDLLCKKQIENILSIESN